MIDKVVILNRNQALIIFTNKQPVQLSSDTDVSTFILWFLGDIRVQVENSNVIEMRRDTSHENTMEIKVA